MGEKKINIIINILSLVSLVATAIKSFLQSEEIK